MGGFVCTVRWHLNWVLFREVCAFGAVSFIFLYGTLGLIRGERSFFVLFITDLLFNDSKLEAVKQDLANHSCLPEWFRKSNYGKFPQRKIPESLISDENVYG